MRDPRVPGFLPVSCMRRIRAGAALALLVALACFSAEARAGCHRDGGRPPGSPSVLANLQAIGALGDAQGPGESGTAPVPLGDGRRGCTGPSCSSNPESASAPATAVPFRLKAEWAASLAPVPAPASTTAVASTEACAAWSYCAVGGVFHPPRRFAAVG